MHTLEIFPTVIVTDTYQNFSKEEKLTLLGEKYEESTHYAVTVDTYVLDKVPLLKSWIESRLKEYAKNIMCIDEELEITQSWCIIHSKVPQKIRAHRHSNSIVSGSFYVAAPSGTAGITFCKNSAEVVVDHPLVDWDLNRSEDLPSWLRTSETIEVHDNKLILFQSHLSHGVFSDTVAPRCVLAFNTWFKNGVGSIKKLNRLSASLIKS